MGWLAIIYFWPNTEYQEQGIIHVPTEVILDTTAPNTPNNEPNNPPDYHNILPPPPCEVEPLEASARNTTPSKSSDKSYIEEASQSSSDIQREITQIIQRVQNSINLDQPAFNGLTHWDLQQINLIHYRNNPHLYQYKSALADSLSSQQFPMDVSQDEDEAVEE